MKYFQPHQYSVIESWSSADSHLERTSQELFYVLTCFIIVILRYLRYIFIIKGFRTIVFILISISTMLWPICPPAFFNKDEDDSPKTLNDKNHQASSQKFRQLIYYILSFYYLIHVLSRVITLLVIQEF